MQGGLHVPRCQFERAMDVLTINFDSKKLNFVVTSKFEAQ